MAVRAAAAQRKARHLTEAEKRRRLPWGFAHGAGNTIFSQLTFFGPVFPLFLSELGLPKTRIGFLLSLLPFCGLLAPLMASAVARAGIKRVFITAWGLRKCVTGLLLLTPWVLERFGPSGAFLHVGLLVTAFALCRSVGETAYYSWFQEVVPAGFRGRYYAIDNILGMVGASFAMVSASYVIAHVPGLTRFMVLISAGVVFGFISVACLLPLPGGVPVTAGASTRSGGFRNAREDRNFRRYLSGLGMVIPANLVFSFVPLFLKEKVGLAESQIVLLQISGFIGSLLSSYLWGWAVDRWGGKPGVLAGLSVMVLQPLGWLVIPRHHAESFHLALAIFFVAGVGSTGWFLSNYRMLYNSVVPPEKKTEYTAVYYAWIGLVGGMGPLLAGRILDACGSFDGRMGPLALDAYTPLFLASLILLGGGAFVLSRLRPEPPEPVGSDDGGA